MSLIVRCVYDITNCVCQAVIHVILRDLTNYYWYSEVAEIENQNKVPSAINENEFTGISKLTEKHDEPNNCIKCYENIEQVCDTYKSTKESEVKNIQIKIQNLNEVEINSQKNLESLDIPNTDNYYQKACTEKYNKDNYDYDNCFEKYNTDEHDTECPSGIFGIKTNYNINENDKVIENEFEDKEDLHNCTKQKSEADSLFHKTYVIDKQNSETASGDYVQNINKVYLTLNSNESIHELKLWDTCTSYYPIATDSPELCSLKGKPDSYETNENKEHEISSVSDNSERSYNLSDSKFKNATNDKSTSEKNLEIIEPQEIYNEQETNCDEDNWVIRFLPDTNPELSIDNKSNIVNTNTQCECLKMHSCLQVINFDDQDDLLTDEQLQSVETGSVSDWLYRVSPAICLLTSNDVLNATPEELHNENNEDAHLNQETQFDDNEHIIKTLYIKKWLDNTQKYYFTPLPRYYGSGDYL